MRRPTALVRFAIVGYGWSVNRKHHSIAHLSARPRWTLVSVLLSCPACAAHPADQPRDPIAVQAITPKPEPSADRQKPPSPAAGLQSELGKELVVEGTAANTKLGAMIETDRGVLWIDGLESWPEGICPGGGRGKRIRVTGILIERADLPVFAEKPGEPPVQGMPVPPGTELSQARKRYLLHQARWVELP